MQKKYVVRPTPHTVPDLKEFSPLLQNLLISRGITNKEEAYAFVSPDYEKHTHDPFLFADMEKAVGRVLAAIDEGQKILIYSDYDADGIPGAVVLSDFFKKIGYAHVEVYIPHRHDEGYGLHLEAVETFLEKNIKLLITIDCGIVDHAEVEKANSLGIDVIITDHHEPKDTLPPAYAVLNPKRADCMYPEKMLCGSGVIFKFIQAIFARRDFKVKPGAEKWFLDMVGLATLSDMVPLRGENRVFAHFGLRVLRKSPRPGLQALLRILKIDQRFITEDDVGFMITPRINAASRMGRPQDAFNLLSGSDPLQAIVSAKHLDGINDERKGVVASIVKEVKKRIIGLGESLHPVIVMGSLEWRPSLLGLVANSVSEEMKRPVFLWGRDGGDEIKGSCRSDGVTDLVALMEKAKEVFVGFGGHKLAGGFSILKEKLHTLEEILVQAFKEVSEKNKSIQEEYVDASLALGDVNQKFWNDIEKLAPFGVGNPKPVFLFENVTPSKVGLFGKQKNHLEVVFDRNMDRSLKAIGFFMIPEQFSTVPEAGKKMNMVATIEKSFFMNRPEIRLRIVDII
ncbi:MAG: single-stranded-DNA-specific exonuclease, single-stranded-DNA-specific exonuclease [Candidatus Parcubacteria bacterium]|jgi:single-stranded-DNA-specific exonuclease